MRNIKLCVSAAKTSPMTAPIPLNGTIEECLKTAGELGYDAIEYHTRENVSFDIESIKKAIKETGVQLACLITGRLNTEAGLDLINDDSDIVAGAMDGMKKYIDVAAALDTDLVLGWARGKIPAGKDPEEYYKKLAENMKALESYIGDRNVRIFIEAINRYEINTFNTCAEEKKFIEDFELQKCKIHLDTYHMNIEEDNMVAAIENAGRLLGHVHVADNQRRFPGSGAIDFAAVLDALDKIGYDGYISVECLPLPDGITAAKQSVIHLRSL